MALQLEAAPKICGTCGTSNASDARRCETCGRERFAPPWVRALRSVGNGVRVRVTEPHEESEGTEPVLSFYKGWRGGYSNFLLHEQAHWERIKEIVDAEFLEHLGWTPREELATAKDPRLLLCVAEELARSGLAKADLKDLGEIRKRIAVVAARIEDARRTAIQGAIEDVSQNPATASAQLARLVEEQAHNERITATLELRRRVGMLELLKERLRDELSYKLVNYRSPIHRLLERATWIFDERYWLTGSGKELRLSLDRAVVANDQAYARKPPDFACAVHGGRLLVVSVKPPKGELSVADLDKLERQVAICRALGSFEEFEAVLVGKEVSGELREAIDLRDDAFKVKTYDGLIEEQLKSYSARLKAMSDD
jgi:ribosomal protein L40E